jgi:hypothetical protein
MPRPEREDQPEPPISTLVTSVVTTVGPHDRSVTQNGGKPMTQNYESTLHASQRVNWSLDDVLASDASLDFERPFLPETLARSQELAFLDPTERRTLNQIRAHGYLATFGLVEEFILPFVVDRLQERIAAALPEQRSLLAFASEEAKHIALFRRFGEVFERGFGRRLEVIGPADAIRAHVLGHSELGVGLLILHIEWMTQKHYIEMVRDDGDLEPNFKRLLHKHWLEESQHARIDGWVVDAIADKASPEERARGLSDYVALLDFIDKGLGRQVELDAEALAAATGRVLNDRERDEFTRVQHAAQRATYLGAGVTHPNLRAAVERVFPAGLAQLDELARRYS